MVLLLMVLTHLEPTSFVFSVRFGSGSNIPVVLSDVLVLIVRGMCA